MLDRNLIGKEIFLRQKDVERGAVLRFIDAMGGAGGGHIEGFSPKNVDGQPESHMAPPMFAMTLGLTEGLFEMLKIDPCLVLLGEQSIDLSSDIYSGDRLEIATSIKDLYQRSGTSGVMSFMVIEDEGRRPDGSLVFRMRRTFIARTRPERPPERA